MAKRFAVVCPDYNEVARGEGSRSREVAEARVARIDGLGHCRFEHEIVEYDRPDPNGSV